MGRGSVALVRLMFLLAVAAGGLLLAQTQAAVKGSDAPRSHRIKTDAAPIGEGTAEDLPPAPTQPPGSLRAGAVGKLAPRAPYMKAACELP